MVFYYKRLEEKKQPATPKQVEDNCVGHLVTKNARDSTKPWNPVNFSTTLEGFIHANYVS